MVHMSLEKRKQTNKHHISLLKYVVHVVVLLLLVPPPQSSHTISKSGESYSKVGKGTRLGYKQQQKNPVF